ncbi:hypothetical protein O181_032779 [Austropuccinia psidii MF-1]|uniref:Uncharacterized protein n=1 Tax=Austropuccinia psidii MF-1 TaxID=1389203 RepID=A0A9Q3CXG5_9BASI|nr:hypothetical protein [Austropuccinia psidii MF-1]
MCGFPNPFLHELCLKTWRKIGALEMSLNKTISFHPSSRLDFAEMCENALNPLLWCIGSSKFSLKHFQIQVPVLCLVGGWATTSTFAMTIMDQSPSGSSLLSKRPVPSNPRPLSVCSSLDDPVLVLGMPVLSLMTLPKRDRPRGHWWTELGPIQSPQQAAGAIARHTLSLASSQQHPIRRSD